MPMSKKEAAEFEREAPALAPFDWTEAGHAVVKAGEAVDWDFRDPASFIKRVQSIEYGLSAETEFASILSWLGRCARSGAAIDGVPGERDLVVGARRERDQRKQKNQRTRSNHRIDCITSRWPVAGLSE